MTARAETARQESVSGAGSMLRLRHPQSFLKLILLGFALVGLPLIIALINNALSIDRLADHSRKAVYQAAQIAHSSRALADEIATMERAVRQTHILETRLCWKVISERITNSKARRRAFSNFPCMRSRSSY